MKKNNNFTKCFKKSTYFSKELHLIFSKKYAHKTKDMFYIILKLFVIIVYLSNVYVLRYIKNKK
jgi:hypothetical protein